MPQSKNPIPDYEKIPTILHELKSGKDRTTVAKSLGYSNPKSLDIYMRRKGFIYDNKNANYIPLTKDAIVDSKTFSNDKRISSILSMFSQENPDPRRIAEITGFDSHIELAEFMKANNFAWNDRENNYTRLRPPPTEGTPGDTSSAFEENELHMYLPLLKRLYECKDRLYALIDGTSSEESQAAKPIMINPQSIKLTLPEDLTKLIRKFLESQKIK